MFGLISMQVRDWKGTIRDLFASKRSDILSKREMDTVFSSGQWFEGGLEKQWVEREFNFF